MSNKKFYIYMVFLFNCILISNSLQSNDPDPQKDKQNKQVQHENFDILDNYNQLSYDPFQKSIQNQKIINKHQVFQLEIKDNKRKLNELILKQINYFLKKQRILDQCYNGEYFNVRRNKCLPCDQQCQTCGLGGLLGCTSCKQQYVLIQGQCLYCDINNGKYYNQNNNTCNNCIQNCRICQDGQICQACYTGFQLSSNYKSCYNVISNCQTQQYFDGTQCQQCDLKSCLECINSPKNCTKCQISQYLNTSDNSCKSCDQSCAQCIGPGQGDCIVCNTNYYSDQNGNCVKCNEDGYFKSGSKCLKCDSSCLKCSDSFKSCTECTQNLLFNSVNKTCKDKCDYGFYQQGSKCFPCDQSCRTCSGSPTSCLTCAPNYFQYEGSDMCRKCPINSVKQIQNCVKTLLVCQFNSISNQYELVSICDQCVGTMVVSNNTCIQSCSLISLNYIYNPQLKSCQCSSSHPFQHNLKDGSILCNANQLLGYFCDSKKMCSICQIQNCQECNSDIKICNTCKSGFYLWQNYCIPSCDSSKNLETSSSKKSCKCFKNYFFLATQKMCISKLVITSIKLSTNSLNNIITVTFNRVPFSEEKNSTSLLIDPNKLILDKDYLIASKQFSDQTVVFEANVQKNLKISQFAINYNGEKEIYNVENIILTSQNVNENLKGTQNTIQSINNAGQTLSPQEGVPFMIIKTLKNFQILCLLSNFVQILGPLVIYKAYIPQPTYVGTLLAASFIFTKIPDSSEISSNNNQSSQAQDNNSNSQAGQSIFQQIGYDDDIFSNLLIPHLLLILAVVITLLCLFARWVMKGKQYTITVVNIVMNTMSSLHQGYITCTLLSIFYVLENSSQKQNAIMQLIFHIIFIILLFCIMSKLDAFRIQINMPNFILNLNVNSKGWKSYLLLSYVKKYTCILLIIFLRSHPFQCGIIISIIFLCFAVYLLYFRFFSHKFFTIYKIIQEFMISLTFLMFSICAKKQINIQSQDEISDEDMIDASKFSLIVLILFGICLIISFILFLVRTVIQIQTVVWQIIKYFEERKQNNLRNIDIESLLNYLEKKQQNIQKNYIFLNAKKSKLSSSINSLNSQS